MAKMGDRRPRGENVEYDKLADRFYASNRALADAEKRIAQLEAALMLLTNGFKYSTEVVTIARTALGVTAETPVSKSQQKRIDALTVQETDGECQEHKWERIAINNAKSPADPPEWAYSPYKCVRCGMYQSQAKIK